MSPLALSPRDVPLELWLMVMKLLPRESVRSCLQVCRVWHSVSLTLLFSTVKLFFPGGWGIDLFVDERRSDVDPHRLAIRSWEIIDHISSNPAFAGVIRTIIVYATNHDQLVFEKLCLMKALRCVSGLVAFEWTSRAYLSDIDDILRVLANSCPCLKRLRYPPCGDVIPDPFFQRLTHLHLTPPPVWEGSSTVFSNIVEVFDTSVNTLTTLELECASLKNISASAMQVFTRLRELTVRKPYDVDALLLPLRHEHALETLGLRYVEDIDKLRTFLLGACTLLPRLSTFLLSTNEYLEADDLAALCDFLLTHSGINRLSLQFNCSLGDISPLLPAFQKMRSLQALWIETGPTAKYDIIPLLKVLPRSLRVLAFYVQYDAYIELLQLLSGLPCLASVCLPHNIPLTAELLAMDIPNLTFVATGTRAVKLKRDFLWAPAELCPMTTLELGTLHASDLDDPDLAWMTDMLRAWLTSPVWNAIH